MILLYLWFDKLQGPVEDLVATREDLLLPLWPPTLSAWVVKSTTLPVEEEGEPVVPGPRPQP